jgi:hypothetical protein
LIVKRVTILNPETFRTILTATIETLQKNLPPKGEFVHNFHELSRQLLLDNGRSYLLLAAALPRQKDGQRRRLRPFDTL